jgi:hypothetical protein
MKKYTYKYDDKGNKIEKNKYNPNGTLFDKTLHHKYIYKYDEKGNKIEKNECNLDKTLRPVYIYKYDDYGNWIESIHHYREDNTITERTIKYYK